MKILIFTLQISPSASRGHVHPWVGVVQRLVGAGHDVLWCPLPSRPGADDARLIESSGATLLEAPPLPAGVLPSDDQFAEGSRDEEEVGRVYASFLLDPVEIQLPWVKERILDWQPHAIAADSMLYSVALACRELGLPYTAICAGLTMLHDGPMSIAYRGHLEAVRERREQLFAREGVSAQFRLLECLSEQANLVFTVPSFARSPGVECVGPSVPVGTRGDALDFPWDRIPEDVPVCFASFGSAHSRVELPDVVPALVYACRRLKLFLVLSSEFYAREEDSLGANTLVVPYAPQLDLLPRCSLFVSHGGANSVTEALAAGVPQLAVPLAHDQPLQARLLERASVGAWLPPGASPEQFARVLRWLGTDEGVLARLAHVRQEMTEMDGAATAAARIMELARPL